MSRADEPVASLFDRNEILPEDPDLEVLHDREYRVRAFRKDPNLIIRGAVRDQKPPNLYFEDDPSPLTIHHMQVDLSVGFPSLVINDVDVHFETHPNDTCPVIIAHYEKLIGLSIARGFTHKVRELFGGPRGCSHTTALLQAMAPVAVQCFWSMSASDARKRVARAKSAENIDFVPKALSAADREAQFAVNLNTCHVWDEDGDLVEELRNGASMEPPLFAVRRLAELGLTPSDWFRRMRS
ncbi:MAG: hypothetical protein JWN62_325 [Acidimicrobiales bacterium]|nr:hypothetical protein [Acidimicrobiales bacterium]